MGKVSTVFVQVIAAGYKLQQNNYQTRQTRAFKGTMLVEDK